MVADKFRSIFSKKKDKEKDSDEKLVQELHDILEGLEDARAEQLILSSMAKERKEEGESPVSVEEEKEAVEIAEELKPSEKPEKREEKRKIEKTRPTAPPLPQAPVSSKSAREVKVDKQALTTSYIMSTISVLFEAFKSEFLEYVINKSLTDQKTRELLFKSLEKLDKRDLIEIIRIVYKIVDEKLGTGLRVPEITITSVPSPPAQQSPRETTTGIGPTSTETPEQAPEPRPQTTEKGRGKEEEVDLSSLLGEL
ncbi:MAG: hypothetical protein GXO10_07085 [Crenarchaeota archaeon]|nr:hypothetical protein [Thermoproteota archaeon]